MTANLLAQIKIQHKQTSQAGTRFGYFQNIPREMAPQHRGIKVEAVKANEM